MLNHIPSNQRADNNSRETNGSAPEISVVLVCWNNRDYLTPCLRSLYDAGLSHSFDVVVVDNGSTDGSQEMLAREFPEVQIIQNQGNVGLGRASNQGIEGTRGEYVLLLNNDTVVDGPSLDKMAAFLERKPGTGAVGGRLLNADESFQAGYAEFSTLLEEFLIATRIGELLWAGYPSHRDSDRPRRVGWLSSACLMLRRSALEEVGLLDEGYFIYGDEADLQYRLKRANWEVYYLPSANTLHYGGRSMDRWRRRKMVYRGKMLFYHKHYGRFYTSSLRTMFAVLGLLKILSWGVPYLLPRWREHARREITSNLEVLRLCWFLE